MPIGGVARQARDLQAHHDAGVQHEHLEQAELGPRELDSPTTSRHHPGARVERKVGHAEHGVMVRVAAPDEGLDPRQ